jgi:hypothetical protein
MKVVCQENRLMSLFNCKNCFDNTMWKGRISSHGIFI